MLAAVLLQLGVQYLSSALRAFGRFRAVSLGQALQALAGGGLGLLLVWRFGLWGLMVGWIAGTLLALAWMRRSVPEAPLVPADPRVGLGAGARRAAPDRLFCRHARPALDRSARLAPFRQPRNTRTLRPRSDGGGNGAVSARIGILRSLSTPVRRRSRGARFRAHSPRGDSRAPGAGGGAPAHGRDRDGVGRTGGRTTLAGCTARGCRRYGCSRSAR